MGEIGSGSGSSYPGALDTDNTPEVNSPGAGKTKARAEVPNDLASAVVAIETELGTDPAGTLPDVKTFLQTEHNTNGTHDNTLVAMLAGNQTITGNKTLSGTTTASGTMSITGNIKLSKGADVPSEAALFTTSGFPADGNYFDVTGTTDITSIITSGQVGTVIKLHFDGALTLTHNATDLVLPGGVDIVTAAGDEAEFIEYASGDWRCTNYQQGAYSPDIPFTESYTSTEQTITPTGSLTLAHGLSSTPYLITPYLICKTAELGYSVDDEVMVNPSAVTDGFNRNVSIVPDSTNINIRYASNAGVFFLVRKDTGAQQIITDANWKLIIRAWA